MADEDVRGAALFSRLQVRRRPAHRRTPRALLHEQPTSAVSALQAAMCALGVDVQRTHTSLASFAGCAAVLRYGWPKRHRKPRAHHEDGAPNQARHRQARARRRSVHG
jgi:hypothetical protein